MKKIYSIVLMATALLIGTNVWATTRDEIQAAIDAADDGAVVNIQLNSDVQVTTPIQIYAKKAETGKTVNLDLNGKTISANAKVAVIELFKGTLNLVGPGTISTNQNYEAIRVYGAFDDVANWSNLNIGAGVTVQSVQPVGGYGTAKPAANAISIIEFWPTYCKYVKPEYAGMDLTLLDPADYKAAYYVASGKKKTVSTTAGSTTAATELIRSGKIDYAACVCNAGTDVKSGTVSGTKYEWVTAALSSYAAYGVNIEVGADAIVYGDKYGIKVNGNIKTKGQYSPYVHIANGAEIKAAPEASEATAVYSSGYGVFVIEGQVHGSTGVYVKSGAVSVEDGAEIWSDNNTGNGVDAIGKGSGIDAGGNAIAIEGNNASYSNEGISVEINGGTVTAGDGGYAVQNLNNQAAQDNPNAVTISGGDFEGGAAGCVTIDNTNGNVNVELEGGTFTGDIQTLINATDGDKIISEVVATDGTGNATVVIGKKESTDDMVAPASEPEKAAFEFVNNMANDIVKLEADASDIAKTLPAGKTVVKYLSLKGTGAFTSTVTIEKGKTLEVGQIVMNANGRLIVEAGAKLIVTGANGIFADDAENLVIGAQEGNNASFLLSPDVTNNTHPKATVQFISKSYNVSATDFRNQRFGIPTIGALESIEAEYQGSPVQTRIWGYFNGQWDVIGDLNTGSAFDASKMNQPFAYYQMNNKAAAMGSVITMIGNLVGIADPELDVTANDWSTFSNSFMANMSAKAMLAMFDGHNDIEGTLQTYTPTGGNSFAWFPFNKMDVLFGEDFDVEPMQAFIIKNNGAADKLQMKYKEMVWDVQPASAPTRGRASIDMTTARIEVRNAAGIYDYVTLAADNQFSAEYDNGYDAEKIMNNTLDLYTVGTKNLATMATDNLDNVVLGLACAEAGEYTISFSHINGEDLTLVDRVNGERIAMVEGNTYTFVADANAANRFEIVSSHKVATGIENAEAVKNGAVYTITGQYVGQVENWNVLPAGVYVVDGVKCVK